MFPRAILKIALLAAAIVTLAACQDDRERAEGHFRAALELIEAGDTVRAELEFRNVFQADGTHLVARERFARMLRETGDLDHAYRQYLRLVEQDPDHVVGRIALAEMAIGTQNWEEVRWHGQRVLELAPDAPETPIIALNLDYLDAIEDEDDSARRGVADRAQTALAGDPGNPLIQRLVLDSLIRDRDFDSALGIVDAGLATDPTQRALHDVRLQILAATEQTAAIEAQLQEMLRLFPEDRQLPGILLRFHVANDDIDTARRLLSDLAETAGGDMDRIDALTALVQLRLVYDGPEAALAELDRIIETDAGEVAALRALRASLRFEQGDRAGGIAEIEALLESELSQIERGQFQAILAQMLLQDGNVVGAQRLVDTVLEADPRQIDALKMRAAWLIEEDDTDHAIQHLRGVLDDSPEDTEALTLMAAAYARAGDRDLAREFLSLAMQASGLDPEHTIRYALALIDEGRLLLAEEALISALRLSPNHPDLLTRLGQIYLDMDDWSRAEGVERALRALETEAGTQVADQLRVAILAGRGQTQQAMDMLEAVARGDAGNLGAQADVIQARLASGDLEGALSFAEDLVARHPDRPVFRNLLAMVRVANGQMDLAEAELRAVTEAAPQLQQAWMSLIQLQRSQGRAEEASATLAAALAAQPDAPDLLWAQASEAEAQGDIEAAIAIYERLYEILPGSPVVANNLASLISTYRSDQESLDRAYAIARRLRGSDVAAFQDTYGWIAYRRGDLDAALAHLEPAAAALSEDALVQYHLGMAYRALERSDQALAQLTRAVSLAGSDDSRPQFETARAVIAEIEAELASPETEN